MAKFTTTHEINCTPDQFWRVFFDKSATEKLYLEALGCLTFKIIEQSETDQALLRGMFVQPKMNMPSPVAKLMDPGYSYSEKGTFDKNAKVFNWRWTPSKLADKLRLEGTTRVELIGDNKVRLINEVTIEAKIFGIGALMESSFEKQVREENDTKAAMLNRLVTQASS